MKGRLILEEFGKGQKKGITRVWNGLKKGVWPKKFSFFLKEKWGVEKGKGGRQERNMVEENHPF